MQIANPIYDVVFRYLMQDNKVAKLILSALTSEEIVELEFRPTERSVKYGGFPTVLRMDFAALVKTAEGEHKHVLIELQKAKYYLEVMRFRRYLGEQYTDSENKIEHISEDGTIRVEGRRLLPIYILGEKITKEVIPVMRVGRKYVDVATNKTYNFKHEFIEALTHDGIFVQIPHLSGKRRTELEQLLHVFDQTQVERTQKYFFNIEENDYPEKFRPVIRRLKQAISNKEVVDQMKTEDELIDVFRHTERELAWAESLILKANKMAEEQMQQADEAKQQADEAISSLKNAAKNLKNAGMNLSQIAQLLGKSETEVQDLLKDE